MRDILLQILAAIKELAPAASVAADPDSRAVSQEELVPEEPVKEETKEELETPVEEAPAEEKKSTRRTSK